MYGFACKIHTPDGIKRPCACPLNVFFCKEGNLFPLNPAASPRDRPSCQAAPFPEGFPGSLKNTANSIATRSAYPANMYHAALQLPTV